MQETIDDAAVVPSITSDPPLRDETEPTKGAGEESGPPTSPNGARPDPDVILLPEAPGKAPDVLEVPALTISEAAFVCRRNRGTIRRRLEAGAFPNARRAFGDGPWLIPVTDLDAAGYKVSREFAPEVTQPDTPRVAELELEIAVLREKLSSVETLAGEREARIMDFRTTLRLLDEADRADPVQMETLNRLTDLERKLRILIYYLREDQAQRRTLTQPRRRWWQLRRA
ncbi:MAG TPA: hypothetical protein VEM93_01340 [Actinomycetota bacterium]|nr:hypothetical protein [Actinomycetota bacterium]